MKGYKLIILILIVLLSISLIIGLLVGFPWERIKATSEVKKYVEETYGLTPTDVRVTFSIDGVSGAYVYTKELPFGFDVQISRKNMNVWGDLYLEALVEYHLEKFIGEKVEALGNKGKIHVYLQNRFSKKSPELTVEQVNSNPKIIFEIPSIVYSCSINGIEEDPETIFLVFKEITEQFNPTSISFDYYDKDNKKVSIYVKGNEFEKIHNSSDLIP